MNYQQESTQIYKKTTQINDLEVPKGDQTMGGGGGHLIRQNKLQRSNTYIIENNYTELYGEQSGFLFYYTELEPQPFRKFSATYTRARQYHIVQYGIILYNMVSYCMIWYHIVQYGIILYNMISYCTILYYIVLYYIILY